MIMENDGDPGPWPCRLLARIDPAGARLDDYARLLRVIGRAFPGAHAHAVDGLGVIYIGTHHAD
jgi:hypothetical protein